MLSGGLDAANVGHAIFLTGAPIVDVSSGVEDRPGVKNTDLIRKFIEMAKAAG
jgi:phosphoribosylanthranilate isomerase